MDVADKPSSGYALGPPWSFKGRQARSYLYKNFYALHSFRSNTIFCWNTCAPFRALYQLHLVRAETARPFIPKEFKLVQFFGYSSNPMHCFMLPTITMAIYRFIWLKCGFLAVKISRTCQLYAWRVLSRSLWWKPSWNVWWGWQFYCHYEFILESFLDIGNHKFVLVIFLYGGNLSLSFWVSPTVECRDKYIFTVL